MYSYSEGNRTVETGDKGPVRDTQRPVEFAVATERESQPMSNTEAHGLHANQNPPLVLADEADESRTDKGSQLKNKQ